MIIVKNNRIFNLSNKEIEAMYLDFMTDYITVTEFAKNNQTSWFSAKSIIKKGYLINNNK